MDHILELPADPAYETVTTPYIAGGTYDNQGFSDFPSRNGWDIDRLYRGDLQGHSVLEAHRLLQNWLYFGMLSEFLGSTLDPLDFVCEDDEPTKGLRICTRPLEKRLARWKDRMANMDSETKLERAGCILNCLDLVSDATRSAVMTDLMDSQLHLAISVLGSTLDKARVTLGLLPEAEKEEFVSRGQKQHEVYFRFGPNDLIRSRLRANGWCPYQLIQLEEQLTPIALYYSSMIKRPPNATDHSYCTTEHCTTNQVDESTYQTQHVCPGCECESMGPDPTKLAEIIDQGGIPLIAIKPSYGSQKCKIRLVHFKSDDITYLPDVPYIAISHIWRDGLGNVNGNWLPTCQVERLRSLASAIYNKITHCHNEQLQPRAEKIGDGQKSVDDLLFNMKKIGFPVMKSAINHMDEFPDNDMSKALQEWDSPHSEESGEDASDSAFDASSAKRDMLKATDVRDSSDVVDSKFHFLVNDNPTRNFMAHHGQLGKFNLDWKSNDLKDLWEERRILCNTDMGDEVVIWLDTLCIPLEKRSRRAAISKMRDIFANAEKVLVLDNEMQGVSGAASYEENLMRINFSGWMSRGWTLEEAAVGPVLLFQFQDGVFNMWQFGRTWLGRASRSIVLADASRPWCNIHRLQQPRHHIQQMQMAYDLLESRSTSKKVDLNILFSFLMGINVKGVLGSRSEMPSRAKTMLSLQDRYRTGFPWISSPKKEENYLLVGISPLDEMSAGVNASKDPDDS
ncbi:putative het domain-containing protein [Phaeomoniella chlamydospora]|uniref:Putative het domain-containing protein n=1 Tax=Phaeomoniella chlamydospora TaxID=158046 RepID=A0A0G2DZ22_PHACM|nr:putative het domain-containing protein [Phaeomoniella chlamydospora]